MIEQLLDSKGYSSSYSYNRHTALPNNEADFMRLFYNEDKNRIKNPVLAKISFLNLVNFGFELAMCQLFSNFWIYPAIYQIN